MKCDFLCSSVRKQQMWRTLQRRWSELWKKLRELRPPPAAPSGRPPPTSRTPTTCCPQSVLTRGLKRLLHWHQKCEGNISSVHVALRWSQRRQMQSWSWITPPKSFRGLSRTWRCWETTLWTSLWAPNGSIRMQRASERSQRRSKRWVHLSDG